MKKIVTYTCILNKFLYFLFQNSIIRHATKTINYIIIVLKHICYVRCIPLTNVSVEINGGLKHGTHIFYVRCIGLTNVFHYIDCK